MLPICDVPVFPLPDMLDMPLLVLLPMMEWLWSPFHFKILNLLGSLSPVWRTCLLFQKKTNKKHLWLAASGSIGDAMQMNVPDIPLVNFPVLRTYLRAFINNPPTYITVDWRCLPQRSRAGVAALLDFDPSHDCERIVFIHSYEKVPTWIPAQHLGRLFIKVLVLCG